MTISTIGTTGRDYSTCKAWADAAAGTLSAPWEGQCYNDGTITETSLVQLDSVSDVTNFMKLTTASGQSFADHAGKLTNPLRVNQANGVLVDITTHTNPGIAVRTDYVVIEKLQIRDNRVSYSVFDGHDTGSTTSILRQVLLESNNNGDSNPPINIRRTVLSNSAIIITASNSTRVVSSSSTGNGGVISSCTILASGASVTGYAIGDGFGSGQLPSVKNTATFGFGADNAVASGSSNNATNRANFATNSSSDQESLTTTNEIESATNGSEDLRAKTTGTLDLNGVRDQTYTADLDIVGQARSTSTPTIGAWEVVSGGASAEGGGMLLGSRRNRLTIP